MKILPKDLGPCRVVSAYDVEAHCLTGYHLVAVYTEQAVETRPKNSYRDSNGNMQYPGSDEVDVFQVSQTYFIMSKSEQSALAEAQLELKDLTEKLQAAEGEARSLKTQADSRVAEKERQIKKLQTDIGSAREDEKRASEDAEAERAKRTKAVLEVKESQDQLQKLWVEFGRAKMCEVLGSRAAPPIPLSEPQTAHQRVAQDDMEEDDIPF